MEVFCAYVGKNVTDLLINCNVDGFKMCLLVMV